MQHILAKRHLATLAHFASSNVMLAFDYDGTLAAITARPDRARLRARTKRLLIATARRYPCVIISGRAREDVARYLAGVPVWHVFGNHGLEPWREGAAHVKRVRAWVDHLERRLPKYPGLLIEDKTYSIAVHYRHVSEKKIVRKAIDAAIRGLPGSRTIGGKHAINILPRNAPNKGDALERARQSLACDCALYVGDDDTDEDAFRAAPHERLLSIRVGAAPVSAARYHLKTQLEIDSLLGLLVRLRSGRNRSAT